MPLREMNREQMWLLPPTLCELVPPDHPARFVAEFVDALGREDWGEMGVEPEGDPLGAPAYHPRALLSVWLYGFMTNVRSCRKLEAACRDQIPYLWLTGWQHPDHNTLWRFYKRHRQSMRKLFKRTVRTAVEMDLVDLAVQAVDGTKLVANAAPYRSYDAEGLRQLLVRVEKAIGDLEAQNEGGEDGVPARLPEKLADQKALRQRVRQAMDDLAGRERPQRYKRPDRINLTDTDARLMRTRQGVVPGYNAQAVVSPLANDEGITGMLVTAVDVVDNGRSLREDAKALTNHSCNRGFINLPLYLKGPARTGGRNGQSDGMGRRQCTEHYKIRPIQRKIRELLGLTKGQRVPSGTAVELWLGISTDEAIRMKPSRDRWIENRYPLIEAGMSRSHCLDWWEERYERPLERSACIGCPYQSRRRWVETKRRWPELFAEAVEIDSNMRGRLAFAKEPYLHPRRVPLAQAVRLDEAELGADRQPDGFGNECEGYCGV